MKKTPHLLAMTLLAATLALPAAAQNPPRTLDVEPEMQTAASGGDATLTATLRDGVLPVEDEYIRFEIEAGPNDNDGGLIDPSDKVCITTSAGTCTVKFTDPGTNGIDRIRAWVGSENEFLNPNRDATEGVNEITAQGSMSEPDQTDAIEITWTAPAQVTKLNTEPEKSLNLPAGQQVLTATVLTGSGDPKGGVNVDFLIESGPGMGPAGRKQCTTGGDGTCPVTFNGPGGTTTGTDQVRSWIDAQTGMGNDLPDEADLAETQPQEDNDGTDVVEMSWEPETNRLNLVPEQDVTKPGGTHTITVELATNFGAPIANKAVGVTVRSGPNIGDLETCTTEGDGKCSVAFTSTLEGTDEYLGWVDSNNNSSADAGEADFAEGADEKTDPGTLAEPDQTDVTENEWANVELDISPDTVSKEPGQQQTFTVTVKSAAGAAQPGENVDLEVESGPNADLNDDPTMADLECTTGPQGTCTVSYTSGAAEGTDKLRGWLDRNADSSVPGEADKTEGVDETADPGDDPEKDATDVVEATWGEEPPPPPPGCEGTPQDDLIIGTDADDDCFGGAGNDTIRTRGGNDQARGGAGADVLVLGAGNDTGTGGPGSDRLNGGAGNDDLRGGGGGGDQSRGGSGNDTCNSESQRSCET